ncbi:MAG: hypothetical protein ABIW84_03815 [Ilumatobacteraceae bacterium]
MPIENAFGALALEATLADLRRGRSDQRVLFDYVARTDGNPVYIGKAIQGTATSAATWQVQRFTYDASNRPTDIQLIVGIWNNRATLGWV